MCFLKIFLLFAFYHYYSLFAIINGLLPLLSCFMSFLFFTLTFSGPLVRTDSYAPEYYDKKW